MIDKENMLGVLEQFPEQCRQAVRAAKKAKIKVKGKVANVVVCGMGCSGIAAGLAKALEKKIPVFAVKDYKTPSFVGRNSLVFILTYSGSTEEALACHADARRKKAGVVVVTSSAKLAKREKNTILVPEGILPRLALGYMFLPVAVVLQKFKIIPPQDFAEVFRLVVSKSCSREGFMISKHLRNRMVLVYSSPDLYPVAYCIKAMINENAKQASFANTIPDMGCNEIMGFKRQVKKFKILLIRDASDSQNVKKQMEVLKRIIRKKADIVEFSTKGKSVLAKIMFAAYVGSYISYYLALMNKEDPTPAPLIDEFMEKMSER